MKYIFTTILFFTFLVAVSAQQGNRFDFEVQRIDDTNYEMKLQLLNAENVQFIRFQFLEKGQDLEIYEASLNKKSNGKYFLFFQNEEFEVDLNSISLSFTHDFGTLQEPTVVVQLLDFDFNQLDSLEKAIY